MGILITSILVHNMQCLLDIRNQTNNVEYVALCSQRADVSLLQSI